MGRSAIELLLCRLSRSKLIDEICVATSINAEDDVLCEEIHRLGYKTFRGSEKDVLSRYYMAAKDSDAELVVRITGDCPVIDPNIVDQVIELFLSSGVDYASNTNPPTFADGLDVEIFKMSVLEDAQMLAKSTFDREHVTPYIKDSITKKINLANSQDQSAFRLTLDELMICNF